MTRNAITTIPFHGANLYVVAGDTPEETLIAMKPIVDHMGMRWQPQFDKIKAHPILGSAYTLRSMQMPGDDQERELATIPLNRFHFWLATINPNKVPDMDVRLKVLTFQTEAADVLFDHFFGRAIGHGDDRSDRQLGISKMTIHKVTNLEKTIDALSHRVNELIINTDARVATLEYVSVRELLEEAKAIQKGRGRLNRKIGWDMRERALTLGHPQPCRRCPHSGVWLYQRDFAAGYMRERGIRLVVDHNARQTGQGIIHFPAGRGKGGDA